MTTMGERIRAARIAKGVLTTELAAHCGVTHGAVSQWESGLTKNIRLDQFFRLCDFLGADPRYIVYGRKR